LLTVMLLLASLLSIKVSPTMTVSFSPIPVTVRARITPSDEIRSIGAVITGANHHRSSAMSLNGSNASPMQVFTWRDIPPGEYTVYVELYDQSNRVLASASHPVRILSQVDPQ
jgi:hypothetical protein